MGNELILQWWPGLTSEESKIYKRIRGLFAEQGVIISE